MNSRKLFRVLVMGGAVAGAQVGCTSAQAAGKKADGGASAPTNDAGSTAAKPADTGGGAQGW